MLFLMLFNFFRDGLWSLGGVIICYIIKRLRRFLKHQVRGKPSSAASQTEENPIEENMPITDAVIDKMIDRAADLGKEFWVKVEERERAKKQEQPQGDLLV